MEKLLTKAEQNRIPQKLYKKDSRDKIRFLNIDTNGCTIVQTSGLIAGKAKTDISQCVPKNVGRSNETTGEEQAKIEAFAKFEKKLKEGYYLTQHEALHSVVYLPMLAKVFAKEKNKISYPCYAQPKLDGMRALNFSGGNLMSRSGNIITTVPHVQLLRHPEGKQIILDGELYAHGLSFQENMKIIKKIRPGQTEKVMHHIYDIVSDRPFSVRTEMLKQYAEHHSGMTIVETLMIRDEASLMRYHEQNILRGYEGTIVRHGFDGYKLNGRSSSLLKLKDFHDLSLTLKDVIPSEKRPTHGKPLFHWPGAEDDTLGAGLSISHAEAEDLLTNKDKYIGLSCELRFFEYSDTGVPRHPVMHGFRLDK